MDPEDIKEIVRVLFSDIETEAQEIHFVTAINYYQEHGSVPDINYLLGAAHFHNDNIHITGASFPFHNDNIYMSGAIFPFHSENGNAINNFVENVLMPIQNEMSNNEDSDQSNDSHEDSNMGVASGSFSPVNTGSPSNLLGQQIHMLTMNGLSGILNITAGSIPSADNIGDMIDVKKVIKDIDTVPVNMYKYIVADPNSNTECLICYDQFVPEDIVRILPCTHRLHRRCIDTQLTTISHLCPYCKAPAGDYIYYNI